MNDDLLVEARLRAWLQDGPAEAPRRAIAATLAHADAHPRRAGRLGLALRRLHVTLREGLAGPRRPVAVVAGVAVLVVGLTLGSWLVRPIATGPGRTLEDRTPSSAVDRCTDVRYPTQIDMTRWVAGRLECDVTSTDPRATGARSVALSSLTVGAEDLGTGFPPHDEIYGRGTLRTAGGAWHSVFTGQADESQRLVGAYFGTGAYTGLELVEIGTSPDGGAWTYRSWIEPATAGSVPPVGAVTPAVPGATPAPVELAPPDLAAGTEACVVLNPGREERAGDAVHVRGERVRCELASADPRLAGTLELVRAWERLDDGGLSTWGTARLVTADGAWAGPFVGAWQPQLDPGSTIARAWLVPEAGGAGEIILRDEGTATERVVEAEIRP